VVERDPLAERVEGYPVMPDILQERQERQLARLARAATNSIEVLSDWRRACVEDEEGQDDE